LSEKQAGWSPANHSGLKDNPTNGQQVDFNLALIVGKPAADRNQALSSYLREPKEGWWDDVGRDALVDDALTYVELESEATKVRTFKIDLIDGLLQTDDYAAAVVRANLPRATERTVRHRVKARAQRKERLTGENPIHVEAVLTEGALRTMVGGADVMRRQLDWLLELGERSNVDIRVVPAAGAYPAMGTPFYLLSFANNYPDIGYIELLDKGVYLDEPDDVEPYVMKFSGLLQVALAPDKSSELIAEIARSHA
jgi:hypothetical protein